MVGSAENKASSAPIELGLGLSLAINMGLQALSEVIYMLKTYVWIQLVDSFSLMCLELLLVTYIYHPEQMDKQEQKEKVTSGKLFLL